MHSEKDRSGENQYCGCCMHVRSHAGDENRRYTKCFGKIHHYTIPYTNILFADPVQLLRRGEEPDA
jgi:hypothetical protein